MIDNKKVIELLEKNMDKVALRYGKRLPFHIDELSRIKEFSRPYFNVFEAADIKIVCTSDGDCSYIEYNDKQYRDFKELKAAIGG